MAGTRDIYSGVVARWALSPVAHWRACSRRSLPQNSSPSSVKKVGAPKIPLERASSPSALSRVLLASPCASRRVAAGSRPSSEEDLPDHRAFADVAALGEFLPVHRLGESRRPTLSTPEKRHREPRSGCFAETGLAGSRPARSGPPRAPCRATCSGPWPENRLKGDEFHPCAAKIGPSRNGRQRTSTRRPAAKASIRMAARYE